MKSNSRRLIRIVAYARTNNIDTSNSFSGSINQQFKAIHCWAKFNKCEVVAKYEDKCVFGLHKKPPGLKKLLRDFYHDYIGASYVVVCEFNRITRSIEVYEWFQNETICQGVNLISLSESCSYTTNLVNEEKPFSNSYLATIKKSSENLQAWLKRFKIMRFK